MLFGLICYIIHKLKQQSGNTMKTVTLVAANEAIFINQLPTQRAVRFVMCQSNVDRKEALVAITNTLTGYKNKVAA